MRTTEQASSEWAIKAFLESSTHIGRPHPSRAEAEASGRRLTSINGLEWQLVTRTVTVTTTHTEWVTPE